MKMKGVKVQLTNSLIWNRLILALDNFMFETIWYFNTLRRNDEKRKNEEDDIFTPAFLRNYECKRSIERPNPYFRLW